MLPACPSCLAWLPSHACACAFPVCPRHLPLSPLALLPYACLLYTTVVGDGVGRRNMGGAVMPTPPFVPCLCGWRAACNTAHGGQLQFSAAPAHTCLNCYTWRMSVPYKSGGCFSTLCLVVRATVTSLFPRRGQGGLYSFHSSLPYGVQCWRTAS